MLGEVIHKESPVTIILTELISDKIIAQANKHGIYLDFIQPGKPAHNAYIKRFNHTLAVGILAASQQIWPDKLEKAMFIGELSLDGSLRHTKGTLSMAAVARDQGFARVFVPEVNAEEAALMPDIDIIAVPTMQELVAQLTGLKALEPYDIELGDAFNLQPEFELCGRFCRHHGPGTSFKASLGMT